MRDMNISANTDGIYITDVGFFMVTGNNIQVPDYGIYLEDGNHPGLNTIVNARAKVINNMVKSDADYGLYFPDMDSTDIWHNTSQGEPGIRVDISTTTALDIRNNIFVSTGDYAYEDDDDVINGTASIQIVDQRVEPTDPLVETKIVTATEEDNDSPVMYITPDPLCVEVGKTANLSVLGNEFIDLRVHSIGCTQKHTHLIRNSRAVMQQVVEY